MGLKVGVCMLLIALGIIAVQGKYPADLVKRDCEDCWKKFQSSFYLFLDQSSDWDGAIAECSRHGAQLLSIKSQEEQDFVNSNLKGRSWLGMTDIVTEGEWIWLIDESAVTYENWAPGEPNNQYDEDYGMLWFDGTWNDTKKDQIRLIICQKQ